MWARARGVLTLCALAGDAEADPLTDANDVTPRRPASAVAAAAIVNVVGDRTPSRVGLWDGFDGGAWWGDADAASRPLWYVLLSDPASVLLPQRELLEPAAAVGAASSTADDNDDYENGDDDGDDSEDDVRVHVFARALEPQRAHARARARTRDRVRVRASEGDCALALGALSVAAAASIPGALPPPPREPLLTRVWARRAVARVLRELTPGDGGCDVLAAVAAATVAGVSGESYSVTSPDSASSASSLSSSSSATAGVGRSSHINHRDRVSDVSGSVNTRSRDVGHNGRRPPLLSLLQRRYKARQATAAAAASAATEGRKALAQAEADIAAAAATAGGGVSGNAVLQRLWAKFHGQQQAQQAAVAQAEAQASAAEDLNHARAKGLGHDGWVRMRKEL